MKTEILGRIKYTWWLRLAYFNYKFIKSKWVHNKIKFKSLANVYVGGKLFTTITLNDMGVSL